MAVTSSLFGSNINIKNISQSTNSLNKSLDSIQKSSNNINSILLKKTQIKRESISKDSAIFQKRRDAVRRRERESIIEASGIGGAIKRQGRVISESTKGFLGRILDFVGSLMTGWLLYNLPTIISMGKELISRIGKLVNILKSFVTNTTQILSTFGSLLGGIASDVVSFNFGNIENQIDIAMKDLDSAFDDMSRSFDEGIKLITTPLGEGAEETPIPNSQTDYDQSYQRGLKPEEQALIATVRQREGTSSSAGYNKFFGGSQYGGDLSQKTVTEVAELQKKFLKEGRGIYPGGESGVVGAGQFKYPEQVVLEMKLDPNKEKFTPELQNKMILFLARRRGIDPTKPLSTKDLQILNKEWSGLGPFYGQNKNTIEGSLRIYQKELEIAKSSTPASETASTTTSTSETSRGGKVIQYITGDRTHKRYAADHGGNNYHDHVAFDSQATRDAAIKWMRSRGWTIGSINTGRHANQSYHYSNQAFDIPFYDGGNYRKKGVTDDAKGETKFSSMVRADLNSGGFGGPQLGGSSTAPFKLEQVSPKEKTLTSATITPERKGQDIIISSPPSLPSQPQVSQKIYLPSEETVDSESLNRFMVTRLLLDLTYT